MAVSSAPFGATLGLSPNIIFDGIEMKVYSQQEQNVEDSTPALTIISCLYLTPLPLVRCIQLHVCLFIQHY